MTRRISIFGSGRGSNFDAILAAVAKQSLPVTITSVVCDQANAGITEKAKAAGIKTHVLIPDPALPSQLRRTAHEEKILAALAVDQPDWIVLAGYMRVFTPQFIEKYSRIINIHPSLLPAFSGRGGYAQAFQYGCKFAGVTVHLVDDSLDGGTVCAQEAFSIEDCRSIAEVEARGLAVEHQLYPKTLEWVLAGRFSIESREGRVCVRKN